MATEDMTYKMAFSFLKKVNIDLLRETEDRGISPEEFFSLPTKDLITKLGIRQNHDFDKIIREEAVAKARAEWNNIKDHNVTPLFLLDEDYPSRLAETYDPPIILYKIGEADLDTKEAISIVGTRKPSPYGVDFCNKLVSEVSEYFPDCITISGLAYGIDATAHKKSLEKGLLTVAVVAHGLNMIYPASHRTLAKEIIRAGGALLSEYPFGVSPFKNNFLARNRIVAGLSDCTVVVESKIKGGAMSTANYAFMYDREVMALPGRISDELSSGCNLLIRKNKAHLIEGAADLVSTLGWQPLDINLGTQQRNLFPELEGNEKKIYEILKNELEPVPMDVLVHQTGLNASNILSLLSEMEFDGIIVRYPGNRFSVS